MPQGKKNGHMADSHDGSTVVTFLLDRTGSMSNCKDATIEAFNAYLRTLKKGEAGIEFTFLQFDSMSLDKICVAAAPKDVPELTHESYQPRASTPLVDAAYKTIMAIDTALKARSDRPKVLVCIQTDGYENASVEHTMDELNALIKEKSAQGWLFNFMGASIDAYGQGAKMGITARSTVSYDKTSPHRTRFAFAAMADNTVSYSTGRRANTDFSVAQKMASGDTSDAKHVTPEAAAAPSPQIKPHNIKKPLVDDFKI